MSSPNLNRGFIKTIKKNDALSTRGGTSIPQIEESSQRFVCPNESCKKTFTKPLKTLAIGVSDEPYNACPYCLTRIPADARAVTVETNPKTFATAQTHSSLEKRGEVSSTPSECKNQFGYLGQRSGKEIPDDCLTCKLILQCMSKSKAE